MSGAPAPSSDDDKYAQMVKAYEEQMRAAAASEAPMGAAQQVQTTLSMPHLIRLVILNTLVLAELCLAVYMASQQPEEASAVFFKVFFALFVPTMILGSHSKRWLHSLNQEQREQRAQDQ